MGKYGKRRRAFLPLLLCSLLLTGWPAYGIESRAATADELEQSIKEKEEAISQAQEQKDAFLAKPTTKVTVKGTGG